MARACVVFAIAVAVVLSAPSDVQAAPVHSGSDAVRLSLHRRHISKQQPARKQQQSRSELTEAVLKSASMPFAEFDTQYTLMAKNASFAYRAACEVPGAPNGQRLLLQSRDAGTTVGVVVATISAGGIVTELRSFNVDTTGEMIVECVAGVVVFWTLSQLYAVNSTGSVVVSFEHPTIVAVEGAAIYVGAQSVEGPTLHGFHVSGAKMFGVDVPCDFGIALIVPQPVAGPTEVPGALWTDCDAEMIYNATNGAVIATAPGTLMESGVYAATPSSLVGVGNLPASGNPIGFGVSWTTGQVMWQSTAITTTNGPLFAIKDQDVVVSLTRNDAPVPCNFVVTDARTGATTSSANFTCDGSQGVNIGMVDGASHLVSVTLMNSDDTNNLYAIDVRTSTTVLNITTPAPVRSNQPESPLLGRLMTLCAGTTLVVGQTFPSVDGLVRPTRVATYSYPSGTSIAASQSVFANSPLAVTCGGNNGTEDVSIVAPEAVVSVGAVALPPSVTPTSPPIAAAQLQQSAGPAAVSIRALWNVSQNELGVGIVGSCLTAAGTAVAIFNNGFPSVYVSAFSGTNGSTLWNAKACNNQPQNPELAIDEANGLAWVLCQSGTTALNLTTGAVEYMSGPAEQQVGTPVFAPGFVAYTNVSAGIVAITLRTRAANGSWSVASSSPVPAANDQPNEQLPVSLILKQDAGVVVGFVTNGYYSDFTQPTIAAISIDTGELQWTNTDVAVAAMPGNGQISNGPIALIGSVNEDGVPQLFSLDAATGAVVWTVGLGQYIGPDEVFFTACSADGASVYVGTAPAVMKVDVASGNVMWSLLDTRYFVPLSGTTFEVFANVVFSGLWIAGGSVIVSTNGGGAWVLSGATGSKLASVAAANAGAVRLRDGQHAQAFTNVAGMPNVALSAGVANVSVVAVGSSPSAGAALATVDTFNGPYTWVGTSATGTTSSLAGLQSSNGFSVFRVEEAARPNTTASPPSTGAVPSPPPPPTTPSPWAPPARSTTPAPGTSPSPPTSTVPTTTMPPTTIPPTTHSGSPGPSTTSPPTPTTTPAPPPHHHPAGNGGGEGGTTIKIGAGVAAACAALVCAGCVVRWRSKRSAASTGDSTTADSAYQRFDDDATRAADDTNPSTNDGSPDCVKSVQV